MLNSIVTIICIALIAFILFLVFSKKPEKSGQKAQQKKRLPRDSSGSHGGIHSRNYYPKKNRNLLALFLIEKILHLAWTKSFFQTLECMQICLWETNMWLKSLLKKQVSMVSLVA